VAPQAKSNAHNPYGGRRPTAHERQAGQPWDASYQQSGGAPWDIGAPQPAVVRLVEAGVFRGDVLDAGCGTGENTLCIAETGLRPLGVDVAPTAIEIARTSASARGLQADFAVADALNLSQLNRRFDVVLDCALFHALDAEERRLYVQGLEAVTRPGADVYVLCFGDAAGHPVGPHPVSRDGLSAPFIDSGVWEVTSIAPERLYARFAPDGVSAWAATLKRVAPS
jgi:SAM-dependent methyltransferase